MLLLQGFMMILWYRYSRRSKIRVLSSDSVIVYCMYLSVCLFLFLHFCELNVFIIHTYYYVHIHIIFSLSLATPCILKPVFFAHLQQQLDELRTLVRSPLSKMGRQILSALIVIEVHARDVVTNMVDEEVCNVNDFEWISQLRFVLLVIKGAVRRRRYVNAIRRRTSTCVNVRQRTAPYVDADSVDAKL